MSLDAGVTPERGSLSTERARFLRRASGVAVMLIGGPAAMSLAVFGFGMGLVEGAAILILLSGWLGPRLMRSDA